MNNERLTKEQYVNALAKDIYEVCFEKKDGSYRVMQCTLRIDLIPKQTRISEKARIQSPNVVSVYDLVKCEWRSFRIDSVVIFKKL